MITAQFISGLSAAGLQKERTVPILPEKWCWGYQGGSLISERETTPELPLERMVAPGGLFGDMEGQKLYGESDGEDGMNFESKVSASEFSGDRMIDSEDGSAKDLNDGKKGVFVIY